MFTTNQYVKIQASSIDDGGKTMMAKKMEVDEVVKQTYRYYYDDGLVELAIGVLFVLLGVVLLGWQYISVAPAITIAVVTVTILLILVAPFLVKRLVQTVKSRVTYQRTGYVAYREGDPGVGRWLIVGGTLLLVILMFIFPEWLNTMPFVVGALLALILALMGYRVHLWRFYLVAAIALITGTLLALFGTEEILGTALTFAATGMVLLVSGGIALLVYLSRHPQLEEGTSDG